MFSQPKEVEVGVVEQGGQVYVNGVACEPVVEQCEGCGRIKEIEGGKFCASYPVPEKKWHLGACNFATHVRAEVDKAGKVKINPLKASKRAAKRR